MDQIKPIVINSRAAENHLNTIKSDHADRVTAIQEQNMRVSQLKAEQLQQKQVQDQENHSAKVESDKATFDGQARILEQQNKSQELAIKQQALTSTV